jgi:hypothetical protein
VKETKSLLGRGLAFGHQLLEGAVFAELGYQVDVVDGLHALLQQEDVRVLDFGHRPKSREELITKVLPWQVR